MATPPRKTGGGKAGGPPPAAEPPPAADRPVKLQAVDASRPEIATYTAQTSSTYTIPPQGPGAPTRLRYDGGAAVGRTAQYGDEGIARSSRANKFKPGLFGTSPQLAPVTTRGTQGTEDK